MSSSAEMRGSLLYRASQSSRPKPDLWDRLTGDDAEEEGGVKAESAVFVDVSEVVLLRRYGHEALDVRAAQRGGLGLSEAQVGDAEHPDVAVAPGLRADPLLRVVPVLGLVDVRLPRPLRVEPAAAVLHHDRVAGLHEAARPLDVDGLLVVVDRTQQQCRERPAAGRPNRCRSTGPLRPSSRPSRRC